MGATNGLNDAAWDALFIKYDILNKISTDGKFQISAAQIKEFREPRLMAKFDHAVNLPFIFSRNRLAILPITRGDYVIAHFDAYHEFENGNSNIKKVTLPSYIQSLNPNNITSEAAALNCAAASGMIADFSGEDMLAATVSGRMGSGNFSFGIEDVAAKRSYRIDVNNSQIEIDAAYEGMESLVLFEAKRDLSEDFLIRQLYYPYRVWRDRVTKRVRPMFMVYTNGVYRLYEYIFRNPDDYNSIELVKQMNYSVENTDIEFADIVKIYNSTAIIDEPQIQFPQADKFERVINLCELVGASELSRNEVTRRYDFDERQTNYYTDAARYLGLLEKRRRNNIPVYELCDDGRRILNLSYKQRQFEYCRRILSHKAFNKVFQYFLRNNELPTTAQTVSIMKESNIYAVKSDSTFNRRASTVKAWVSWIANLVHK